MSAANRSWLLWIRKRRRRIGCLIALFLVVGFLLFGVAHDYCMLCGRHRTRMLLAFPALQFNSFGRATELSRVIEPLYPGGRCPHEWREVNEPATVIQACIEAVKHPWERYVYDSAEDFLSGPRFSVPGRFAVVAHYDPELAKRIAAILLPVWVGGDANDDEAEELFQLLYEFGFYAFRLHTLPVGLRQLKPPVELVEKARMLAGLSPDLPAEVRERLGASD